MKQIGEVISQNNEENKPKIKKTIKSERQYLLSQFVEAINSEVVAPYQPFSGRLIALRTAHLTLHDLKAFYSMCVDYKRRNGSFSKFFWGSLKKK